MSKIGELIMLGQILWVSIIVLLVMAYVTVGLRLFVRYRITKSPGWDDAAMVLTLMLFTCYATFLIIITRRGAEQRLFALNDIHVTLVYIQLSEVFYILTTTTLKISLGLSFLRVLTRRWQTMLIRILLVASTAYGLFYFLTAIFACGNPAKFTNTLLGSRRCLPRAFILSTGYLYGAVNIIADWTFVLIPICVLVDSNLDRRAKISVSIVMALGAVGSVSSIMRMVYLKGLLILRGGLDPDAIKATIWATAEPGTGIIAASIALLRPLVRNITTSVRTRASAYGSRKASVGTSKLHSGDSTIELTSTYGTQTSIYSTNTANRNDDPWSPTVVVGHGVPQRVLSVHMVGGKGPAVPPKR
ncbi:hypothetical protein DM02DRAFT_702733 [Periconia macrospinosa]|uniref:Rhodopsin domain-containing protein n=1 Tax=Periconia macrospinosa TaxID=97972 RepID=A0A2V1D1F4_9PLEO|nr:hypothetical protein DM02DRAFT_702733 [Periconia macrospinosa]